MLEASLRRVLLLFVAFVAGQAATAAEPSPNAKPGKGAQAADAAPTPEENPVLVFDNNEREPAEMQAARDRIPPVKNLELPADRLKRIPRTIERLREGRPLRIVMLGDSIVNDMARSAWHELVAAMYPGSKITRIVVVRGNTGCWYYKESGRIDQFVLAHRPHLVIIGGISQQNDVKSIADCLTQIRARMQSELFLMTGPYGAANPLADRDWRRKVNSGQDEKYAANLRALADQFGAEFFDLQRAWGTYVRTAGKPLDFFKRDAIHANAEGEAVLAKIMEQYFAPPK